MQPVKGADRSPIRRNELARIHQDAYSTMSSSLSSIATTIRKDSSARLDIMLKPEHYDITFKRIDLVNFNFEGHVSIECNAVNSTDNSTVVEVHAHELQLIQAKLIQKAEEGTVVERTAAAEEFTYNVRDQTCEILFDTANFIIEGKSYVLVMEFTGVLNDQMRGFYRSTYKGLDGEMHTMATTQFEPTDARRAFPCFDEPALKATFCLTATVPEVLNCISNTPMAECHTIGAGPKATKTITFQKTPKMSTYLLALVVGKFDCISKTSNRVVTTIYTVPGKAAQGQFCLDVAVRGLDLFQELFEIPYPLVKSDLLAIPDFAAGAMENWGCVTYREAKILVKATTTSESTKRGIARTVCHELAHCWFGNLVTMDYWTQLYLKEGVARFMEFVAIDSLFPEWEAWTEFVQGVYGMALSLDSMESSHPVEVEVSHPDQINSIFDSISYAKGASIIRMIASYIGMDAFFKGMRIYLARHAYGNAVTNDLWQALEEASGLPVIKFMSPWTLQVGFPVLSLGDDGNVEVERFLAGGPIHDDFEDDEMTPWPIPVTARVEGLDEIQGPWVLNGPNGDDTAAFCEKIKEWSAANLWFKLNVDQTGFFRVSYTPHQWKRLSAILGPDSLLSTTDQLGLLSDSFASGKSGFSSIVDSLSLIARFGEHELAEYAVWQELSENLLGVISLFRSEPFFGELQVFVKRTYARQMSRLGWYAADGEPARAGTLRATVIGMMGVANHADVMKTAFERFMEYKQNPEVAEIPGDLRRTIFRCALRHDEESVYKALKEMYEEASVSPEEQRNILSVMGCVKESQRHAEMLDYVLWSGKLRLQDISYPLASLSGSTDEGGRACWNFLKTNYASLITKLGSGPMWPICVDLCCRGVRAPEDAVEMLDFFSDPMTPPGSAHRRMMVALEVVKTTIARRERDREAVGVYFRRGEYLRATLID